MAFPSQNGFVIAIKCWVTRALQTWKIWTYHSPFLCQFWNLGSIVACSSALWTNPCPKQGLQTKWPIYLVWAMFANVPSFFFHWCFCYCIILLLVLLLTLENFIEVLCLQVILTLWDMGRIGKTFHWSNC